MSEFSRQTPNWLARARNDFSISLPVDRLSLAVATLNGGTPYGEMSEGELADAFRHVRVMRLSKPAKPSACARTTRLTAMVRQRSLNRFTSEQAEGWAMRFLPINPALGITHHRLPHSSGTRILYAASFYAVVDCGRRIEARGGCGSGGAMSSTGTQCLRAIEIFGGGDFDSIDPPSALWMNSSSR